MSQSFENNNVAVGIQTPTKQLAPKPIVAQRAPTTSDRGIHGQVWTYESAGEYWVCVGTSNASTTWVAGTSGGGAGVFTSLTVTPGPISLTGTTSINTTGSAATTIGSATAGAIGLQSSSTITANAAGVLTLQSTANGASAVILKATIGGVDVLASGASAGEDINITASGSSVNVTSTESVADAVKITASGVAGGVIVAAGTGGINNNAAGIFAAQDSAPTPVASPGTSATCDANLGTVIFTGFTTAALGTQSFTIVNSLVSATSGVLVTVANLGSNDAQMTLTRVKPAPGSIIVNLVNNGAAALNGDVQISFWVYRA